MTTDNRTLIAALALSAAGLVGIAVDEGYSTKAYPDPVHGTKVPTIGFGTTSGVKMGGTGYWVGDKNRNNAWLAKQAVVERKARQELEAEVKRGNEAALQSIADQVALQTSYSTLEGEFNELRKHGPLVVLRSNAVRIAPGAQHSANAAADAIGTSPAQTPAQPGGEPSAQAVAPADVDAAGLGLTLGAVWMWNSALTGFDAPAGACGAADTAAPACALDAGVSLDAAWANHIANAKTCAQDRLRHQRLIDFLTAGATP